MSRRSALRWRGRSPGLGWRLVLALVLLLLCVSPPITRAQQGDEDEDGDGGRLEDMAMEGGGKAWTSGGDEGEDVSGNKTTALSHKRVPPETGK